MHPLAETLLNEPVIAAVKTDYYQRGPEPILQIQVRDIAKRNHRIVYFPDYDINLLYPDQ